MDGSGGERRGEPTKKWPGVRATMYYGFSDIRRSGRKLRHTSIRASAELNSSNVNISCFAYR